MGNYFSSESNEEKLLLTEYERKMYALDGAMFGLVSAIDRMDGMVDELESNVQTQITSADQDGVDDVLSRHRHLVNRLSVTSKWTVQHQKDSTIKLLGSLVDFMKKAIKDYAKSMTVDFKELYLDKYNGNNEKSELQIHETAPNPLELQIEKQETQIKELYNKISLMSTREETYINVEHVQHKEIESREKRIAELTENELLLIEKLENTSDYEQKHNDLIKTLQSLQEEYRLKTTEYESSEKELKLQNENLTRTIKHLESSYQNDMGKLQETNANEMTRELEDKQTQIKHLRKQNEEYSDKIESLRKRHENKKNKLKTLILNLTESLKEKEQHLQDCKQRMKNTLVLQEENENLRERIRKLTNANELLINTSKEECVKSTEQHKADLREVEEKHSKEIDQKMKIIRGNEYENKQKSEKISQLQLDLSAKMSLHESEVNRLNEKVSQFKDDYDCKIEQANKKTQHVQDKFQLETIKYESELKKKDAAICRLEEQKKEMLANAHKQKHSYETDLTHLKNECESVRKENNQYFQEIDELNCRINEVIETAHKESKISECKLQEKEKCLDECRQKVTRLRQELEVEKESIKTFQADMSSKNLKLEKMMTEVTETKTEMAQMAETINWKSKEIEVLKRKKTLPVQLYSQKSTDLTTQLEATLMDMFKKQFVSDRLELEFWRCSRPSDIHPNFPLLVTCITASRIGTDVANSVQGLPLSPSMAIVIFHFKDEHALPSQLSERVLTGKELKDIGGIYDMAYFSDKGIYPCEMNKNSSTSLVTFIKKLARELNM